LLAPLHDWKIKVLLNVWQKEKEKEGRKEGKKKGEREGKRKK